MHANEQKILDIKIIDLPLSEAFKSISQKNSFQTLRQIVEIHAADLLKIEEFNYHFLQEYIQFLEERKLAHLIKQH